MGKLILVAALLFVAYLVFKKMTAKSRAMTPADARALLGVSPAASIDDIRDAHRRLIAKVHPDSGGSAELAARVNLARDTLVGEVTKT
ncbi:MAG TPA: DnaJ domain-containing protein [Sphingomonadaceae bacterium]|jgi:preprotein translocase subunit Sec63|nr:DnaJ domain-containing protein [Sphingomonadaceae bacterium]